MIVASIPQFVFFASPNSEVLGPDLWADACRALACSQESRSRREDIPAVEGVGGRKRSLRSCKPEASPTSAPQAGAGRCPVRRRIWPRSLSPGPAAPFPRRDRPLRCGWCLWENIGPWRAERKAPARTSWGGMSWAMSTKVTSSALSWSLAEDHALHLRRVERAKVAEQRYDLHFFRSDSGEFCADFIDSITIISLFFSSFMNAS